MKRLLRISLDTLISSLMSILIWFVLSLVIDKNLINIFTLTFPLQYVSSILISIFATGTYIRGGYWTKEKFDGFKEIKIFNGELKKEEKEEILLVLIPWANFLKTTATKIAGRYPTEAILEIHVGDTLEISCWHDARQDVHTYMAVEAGNEMFPIKKTR